MDFTREPIIETIITPKDGYKLVVRSSKGVAQEEYFLEAVQIVSYGNALFFRSVELPKSFLVPVSDYELIEVRETRVVLKSASPDRAIKIGGGREASLRPVREPINKELPSREPIREPARDSVREPIREPAYHKGVERAETIEAPASTEQTAQPSASNASSLDLRHDKKRDRRRSTRRRRTDRVEDENGESGSTEESAATPASAPSAYLPERREFSTSLTSILPPPSQLIADTMHQYRGSELFKDIFHTPTDKPVAHHEQAASSDEEKDSSNHNEKNEEGSLNHEPFSRPVADADAYAAPSSDFNAESTTSKPFEELFFRVGSGGHQEKAEVKSFGEEDSFALESRDEAEGKRALLAGLTEREQDLSPSVDSSRSVHEDQEFKREESENAHESIPASSHWQEPFGKSRKESRGEEDHPLPL